MAAIIYGVSIMSVDGLVKQGPGAWGGVGWGGVGGVWG